jgi:hypothetical protein
MVLIMNSGTILPQLQLFSIEWRRSSLLQIVDSWTGSTTRIFISKSAEDIKSPIDIQFIAFRHKVHLHRDSAMS